MRDVLVVQDSQRAPDSRHQRGLGGLVERRAAGGCVRVQRPPAVERLHRQRRGVRDAEVADRDRHQRAVFDDATHRRVKRRRLAAAQGEFPPQLTQRAAAALVRAVQLDLLDRAVLARPQQQQRPAAGQPDDSQVADPAAPPVHRPHRALERNLEGRRADDEDHQRADEPADGQPEQRTGGHHGADHQMNGDEREQQRPPPVPPPRRQPRPGHREDGGEHGDPARIVEELREKGLRLFGDVEMPLGRGDTVGPHRQCDHRDEARRRVRAEQLPVPACDQPDEDREGQRENGDAVGQIHQVGLGRGEHPDDVGDRFLQRNPVIAGDQRAGDDGPEEQGRQQQSQDVAGTAGQRLQQAASNGDVPPVDPHAD